VHGCTLAPRSGFLSDRTNRHAFDLVIDPAVKAESKLYKRIALDLIFRSPQLQQIEFKGGHILEKLFRALCEHCANADGSGLRILPVQVQELIKQETTTAGRHRRLCDYTAGLTDSLAVRTYKRLYDPDFGSIAELL
jgi:dGTPase